MPIPHLKSKQPQNWRSTRRKYYVSREKINTKNRNGRARNSLFKNSLFANDRFKKKLYKILGIGAVVCLLIFFITIAWISRSLPDPNRLIEREVAQSTKIYDRTGETIIYEIFGEQKRTLVKLEEIPDGVKNATIAIEDKDFYKHKGFSLWAIFRSAVTDVIFRRSAGGSTLTQQFIKNAVLSNEKTLIRKVKELLLAYRLEKRFDKDEILQMYLNEIPYGSTAYGVQAASQLYFGKNVKDINLAEAAVLAALPQAPSRYSPYGSHKDLLLGRQKYILEQMQKQGYISEQEMNDAKNTEIKFKKPSESMKAPHFVMYIKEILSDKYGEKMIEQGGLKITTTLDLYKQDIAEETVKTFGEKNNEKYNASNAALLSLDPKNGQILAMVGSRDFFNDDIDGQVNIITSKRQPGSSIKPLVYATAFLKGYTPDTILYDVVTNFSAGDKPYEPHNYDSVEHGPVTMRKALAGSLNVPAVKTLYLAGIDNVLNLAQDLGYTTLNERDRFGLSLVLGGGEVKPIEHINAFSAFAREGFVHQTTGILKVEDGKGNVLEEYKEDEGKKVLDPKIARLINNILSDNGARAWIFGEKNYLTLPNRPVAAKTGTTNDYRDAWTIGYTPSIITGVWVGNNNNKEMKRGADGSVVAAPIWNDYMQKVLGDTPVENFNAPEIVKTEKPVLDGEPYGKTAVKIDISTGLLATEYTPDNFIEEKYFYQPHCILYYVNKDDPLGDAPKNPADDPQFDLWESRVQAWAQKLMGSSTMPFAATSTPPTEYDNVHKPENQPTINIISPTDKQTILDPVLNVQIEASAPRGINRAEYYINDNLFYANYSFPFGMNKNVNVLNNGFHKLKIRVCDDVDNCSEKEREFNLILENNQNKKIEANLLEPSGDISLNNANYPLKIRVKINDASRLAKTILFYQPENGSPTQIASQIGANGDVVELIWTSAPTIGTYKLFAEVYSWSGSNAKTNPININVSE